MLKCLKASSRSSGLAILVCLALCGPIAASAQGEKPAATSDAVSPRIVNGLATQDFPTTGALLYSQNTPITANNAGIWCSGTLIGCHTFLTAAHCVLNPAASHYWVYLQHGGIYTVAAVTFNPSYPADAGADIGIVTLNASVDGIDPTPINSTHDLNAMGVGLPGLIAGFGKTIGTGTDFGIKRYGAVQTADCNPGGGGNDALVCWDFTAPLGPPGQDSNTCNADSGGPLFMDFGAGLEVVGATSAGTSTTCQPPDHSWDANVYYNRSYIQSQLGADSTATCGGLPAVGDPTVMVVPNAGTLSPTHPSDSFTVNLTGTPSLLRVTLNAKANSLFNPDLYVKQGGGGAGPTNYDCKADGLSAFGACELSNPTPGLWSIAVVATAGAGDYQVTTTVFGVAAPGPTDTPTATAAPATATPTLGPATHTPTVTPTAINTATATPTTMPTDTPTVTPTSTPTPWPDHFACYKSAVARAPRGQPALPAFTPHLGVTVVDQFSGPAPDQHQLDLERTRVLCNPVDKNGEDFTAPTHSQHLEGYTAVLTKFVPRQPRPTPQVKTIHNQFGTLKLTFTAVDRLLVPSSQALGTGGVPPLTAPALDHFKCYRASVARAPRGQPPYPVFMPVTVTLRDQFRGPFAFALLKPTLLCAPADKNGEDPTAPGHAAHLVCYKARLTRQVPRQPGFVKTRVSTATQFGAEVIDATVLEGLCVPSLTLD